MADLKELFKEAAVIAQQVPESMQEAAFNRALDLLTGNVVSATSGPKGRRTRKPGKAKRSEERSAESKPTSKPTNRPRKNTSGVGPKSALMALIDSGFFKTAKTATEAKDYLKTKRGYDLGLQQITMALLRLVRDGIMEREEAEDGKYAYSQPDS